MAKPKKTPRPKAAAPKGFRDYFGDDVTRRKEMLDAIARVYHLYGFDALETSAVETVEALGKFLPDVDRPNEGVFAWQEEGADWLALRYDLTAPLARVAAQYRDDLPSPYRRFSMGPVWRNEKPGPGRFRQFYQCDADTVGAPSVAADAEICAMLADVLEAVGIERGDYIIRVNNRKVLNGVMQAAGLLGDDKATERGIVLRAIDKLDRLGIGGVLALLGAGRTDESGDHTEGAKLTDSEIHIVKQFVNAFDDVQQSISEEESAARREGYLERADELKAARHCMMTVTRGDLRDNQKAHRMWTDRILKHLQKITASSPVGLQGVNELRAIFDLIDAAGYAGRIVIDPTVVRGLGYYTGPVYEAELTFPTLDEKGNPRQFGSVAGGGRYDDLVKRFTGQEVPATGVSIGVDRLLAALNEKGGPRPTGRGPVIVTVMDRDRMADYQSMVADLRRAGIRAEAYLGNPKNFGNQLKYADKRNAPFAIIQGADELARGVVQIKDLEEGKRLSATVSHDEWKEQPAQFECTMTEMIPELLRRLSRDG